LSRLVAGGELTPDEVRAYPECGLDGEIRLEALAVANSREWRQVEFESIDIFELAPLHILIAAQEKAAELMAQAEARADEIRAEARREGEAAGHEQGKSDLLPALVAFADAGQSLIIFEEQLIARYAPHLVQLALDIAEKIIGRAVAADAAIVASVLERAKNEVGYAKQLRICLHPDDLKVLEELRPDLLHAEGAHGRALEVVESRDLSRGGCRLETEAGIVDATLPIQLDEMRRQLLRDDVFGVSGGAPS
jgi:flagellar biosynthesis/type III secretory pathway protein FliH